MLPQVEDGQLEGLRNRFKNSFDGRRHTTHDGPDSYALKNRLSLLHDDCDGNQHNPDSLNPNALAQQVHDNSEYNLTRDLSGLQILDQDWNSEFLNKVSQIKKQFSEKRGSKLRAAPSKRNFA